jgi:hypothetical protein
MYFDKNIPGILYIGYTSSSTINDSIFDLAALLNNSFDHSLPGILIYHNMHLDGAVYITNENSYTNKSFNIVGKARTIVLSKFMIVCESDIALDIFKIISAILSNPAADNSIQEAIDNINKIFVF